MSASTGIRISCLVMLLSALPASGAVYTVATLEDNLTVDAQCSLREAVFLHNGFSAANDCGAGDLAADQIEFTVEGALLLNPALGELALRAPALTIEGPGASRLALDGGGVVAVLALDLSMPPALTVRRLTIRNGLSRFPAGNPEGGAIRGTLQGGSPTVITVEDAALTDNAAQSGGGGSRGGAIASYGTLVVRRSFLARNTSQLGSAILHAGDLTIEDSEVTQHSGATPIQSFGSLGVAHWTIRRSLFRINQAIPSVIEIQLENGIIMIENSTFQGNLTADGSVISMGERGADATVRNSTFAGNGGPVGAGGAVVRLSGLVATNPTRLHVGSSLFAANAAAAIANLGVPGTGVLTAAFNMFDTPPGRLPAGTACAGSTAGGANLCGVAAPGLGPLAANGGPTETMAPVAGSSPAIDAGSNPGSLATDQRGPGFPRTRGPATDIGAFEVTPTTVYVVDSLADDRLSDGWCTLREALDAHNGLIGGDCGTPDPVDDRIVFADGLSGTIALTPDLGSFMVAPPALEIAGPGAELVAIDGAGATSILLAHGVGTRLTVRGLTLRHGHAIAQGLGLAMGGAIRIVPASGPAAVLTVEDAVFADNTAPFTVPGEAPGFGAAIASFGTLRIRRCRFERNQSGTGGAIYHSGTFSAEDSEFVANRAEYGGALWVSGDRSGASISRSLLRANAASHGAVVEIYGGKNWIRNSTLADNRGVGAVLRAGPNQGPISLGVANTTWVGNRAAIADGAGLGEAAGVIVLLSSGDLAGGLTLHSSLFAANEAPAVLASAHAVLEASFNLFDTKASELPAEFVCDGSTAGGRNLCGIEDAGLGQLTFNGGWTRTIPLGSHSPAIDAGDNPANLGTDQRGVGHARTAGSATDIGAYELQNAGCEGAPPK